MKASTRLLIMMALIGTTGLATLAAGCSDGEAERPTFDETDASPSEAAADVAAAEASRARDASAFDTTVPVAPPSPAVYRAFLRDYVCKSFTPWCSNVYPARVIPPGACDGDESLPPDLRAFEPSFAGSNVEVDLDRVPACLHALDNWMLGGPASQAFNACVAALRGKLAIGASGCKTSIDCDAGFCDLTGGAGTCRALKAYGEACVDTTGLGDACSRLGEIGSDFTCAATTSGTGKSCVLTKPLRAVCERDRDCLSGTCTPTFTYQGSTPVPGPWVCAVSRSPTDLAARCERIREDLAKDAGPDAEGGT